MYTAIYKKGKRGYVAWIEEIPGVHTQGATKKEATENLQDALQEYVAARKMMTKRLALRTPLTRARISIHT